MASPLPPRLALDQAGSKVNSAAGSPPWPQHMVVVGGGSLDQAFDTYAASRYLAHLDFVHPARVTLLGQSMGGFSALYAVESDSAANISKSGSALQSSITPPVASPRQG